LPTGGGASPGVLVARQTFTILRTAQSPSSAYWTSSTTSSWPFRSRTVSPLFDKVLAAPHAVDVTFVTPAYLAANAALSAGMARYPFADMSVPAGKSYFTPLLKCQPVRSTAASP